MPNYVGHEITTALTPWVSGSSGTYSPPAGFGSSLAGAPGIIFVILQQFSNSRTTNPGPLYYMGTGDGTPWKIVQQASSGITGISNVLSIDMLAYIGGTVADIPASVRPVYNPVTGPTTSWSPTGVGGGVGFAVIGFDAPVQPVNRTYQSSAENAGNVPSQVLTQALAGHAEGTDGLFLDFVWGVTKAPNAVSNANGYTDVGSTPHPDPAAAAAGGKLFIVSTKPYTSAAVGTTTTPATTSTPPIIHTAFYPFNGTAPVMRLALGTPYKRRYRLNEAAPPFADTGSGSSFGDVSLPMSLFGGSVVAGSTFNGQTMKKFVNTSAGGETYVRPANAGSNLSTGWQYAAFQDPGNAPHAIDFYFRVPTTAPLNGDVFLLRETGGGGAFAIRYIRGATSDTLRLQIGTYDDVSLVSTDASSLTAVALTATMSAAGRGCVHHVAFRVTPRFPGFSHLDALQQNSPINASEVSRVEFFVDGVLRGSYQPPNHTVFPVKQMPQRFDFWGSGGNTGSGGPTFSTELADIRYTGGFIGQRTPALSNAEIAARAALAVGNCETFVARYHEWPLCTEFPTDFYADNQSGMARSIPMQVTSGNPG